jgi:site-specific recombinase XerD
MSIYKRGKTFFVYVPTREGGRLVRTTETTDKPLARQIDSMLLRLAAKRDWLFLDAIAEGRLTVGGLFDADVRNDLDSLRGRLNDVDVSTHIAAWIAAVRACTSVTSDTAQQYLTKVRSLVPEGSQLLRSDLTYARLTEWLSQLPVGPSTKRKAKAAMSSFCEYLLRSEIIEANPMRAVKAPRAGAPRMRWLEYSEMLQLVEAHDERYRVLCALLHGTGIEISAALKLKAGDFNRVRKDVRARGTKTHTRDRVAVIAKWAWKYVEPELSRMLPSALLFPNTDRWRALDALKAACKKVGFEDYRLHDARHSYAVLAIRHGAPFEVVAAQLGHSNIGQVVKVYGRFRPSDEEKRRWEGRLEMSETERLRTA